MELLAFVSMIVLPRKVSKSDLRYACPLSCHQGTKGCDEPMPGTRFNSREGDTAVKARTFTQQCGRTFLIRIRRVFGSQLTNSRFPTKRASVLDTSARGGFKEIGKIDTTAQWNIGENRRSVRITQPFFSCSQSFLSGIRKLGSSALIICLESSSPTTTEIEETAQLTAKGLMPALPNDFTKVLAMP